jgi:hypothetical protein
MENKQTAVEWLISQVEDFHCLLPVDMIEQAKQMEKEQIIDAHIHGDNEGCSKEWGYDTFGPEEYYNKTYK